MNFKELQDRVIQKLKERADPRYWPIAEIKENINQGVREFAKIAGQRRVTLPLQLVDAAEGLFRFPQNILKKDHVYWDGVRIPQVTAEYLDNTIGGNTSPQIVGDSGGGLGDWRTATAVSPTYWLIDDGMVRFYPIPSSLAASGSVRVVQTGTLLNGTTDVTFTEAIPSDVNDVDVFLKGVWQNKDQYSIVAPSTIRMVASQPLDLSMQIVHKEAESLSETKTYKYVFNIAIGQATIILPRPYVMNASAVDLKLGGVLQAPGSYTESTTTSLTIPAPISANVAEVIIYEKQSSYNAAMRISRNPVDMVADDDVPDLSEHTTSYHQAAWEWALFECFSREGEEKDMNMAAFYTQRFQKTMMEYGDVFGEPILIKPRDAWNVVQEDL